MKHFRRTFKIITHIFKKKKKNCTKKTRFQKPFLPFLPQLKSIESGYSLNRSNDTLESSAEILSKSYDGGHHQSTMHHKSHNHSCTTTTTTTSSSNGANGSLITMTLKNNHLIVETEERNVSALDCINVGVVVCCFFDVHTLSKFVNHHHHYLSKCLNIFLNFIY